LAESIAGASSKTLAQAKYSDSAKALASASAQESAEFTTQDPAST
jgi:hypothetical protein